MVGPLRRTSGSRAEPKRAYCGKAAAVFRVALLMYQQSLSPNPT